MQANKHPEYHSVAVKCSGCGKKYTINSTLSDEKLSIEVCSNCHSTYTGERRLLSAGAIDKFNSRYDGLMSSD